MATRRTISRILIVILLGLAVLIALVVFFTWGTSSGGSGGA
jgi:hypothetical protein